MSQQPVEIVRECYEAYNRRDVAALQALCDEQCTMQTVIEGQAEAEPFRGHDGIREWIENENDVWESLRMDEIELRAVGDDRVQTFAVALLRGRESGIDLRIPVWSVIELRGTKVLRLRSFPDEARADE